MLYFLNFLKKKKGSWQNEDFVQGKKQKQKTQDRGVCPQHYIKAASDSMQCADCEGAPPNHVLLGALSVQRSKGALSPPRNASTALGRAAQRAVPGISSCLWTHPDHVLPVGPRPSPCSGLSSSFCPHITSAVGFTIQVCSSLFQHEQPSRARETSTGVSLLRLHTISNTTGNRLHSTLT